VDYVMSRPLVSAGMMPPSSASALGPHKTWWPSSACARRPDVGAIGLGESCEANRHDALIPQCLRKAMDWNADRRADPELSNTQVAYRHGRRRRREDSIMRRRRPVLRWTSRFWIEYVPRVRL